jgi:hypothetical protein
MVKVTGKAMAERIVGRISNILKTRILEEELNDSDASLATFAIQEAMMAEINALLFAVYATQLSVQALPLSYEQRAAIVDHCIDFLQAQEPA